MTKADFINNVMSATGTSKKDAALLVETTFNNLANAISNDGKFSYPGFGTFTVKNRAARQGRNPQTGETIQIAASKNVGFKASSNLKGLL